MGPGLLFLAQQQQKHLAQQNIPACPPIAGEIQERPTHSALRSLPIHQRLMFATPNCCTVACISCHVYAFGEHHIHPTSTFVARPWHYATGAMLVINVLFWYHTSKVEMYICTLFGINESVPGSGTTREQDPQGHKLTVLLPTPGGPVPGPISQGVEPSHPRGVPHGRART
jgi:hypothetical protein